MLQHYVFGVDSIDIIPGLISQQSVARRMKTEKRPGSIVNVSSQASSRALQAHAVYCASKGALDQLTRVMALELGPSQVLPPCLLHIPSTSFELAALFQVVLSSRLTLTWHK